MTETVVVVGHGMVGHRFVQELRARDAGNTHRAVVLSEEPTAAYDRVGLSSYVGSWDPAAMALEGNGYPGDDLVEVRLGTSATSIDRGAKVVTTCAGDRLPYSKLVLATGSYPFVPPVPGHDNARSFVYRTLADLDAIRTTAEAAGPGAPAVVVGGGLLGLEAANALRLLGLSAHIVEFAPRLMPMQVDAGGGAQLAKLVGELGLTVHTGVGTEAITEGPELLEVSLSDGTVIEAALVVFSAGVRPQDALARSAGLEVGERGGVIVDTTCRTVDPDIYAIGEVAAVQGRCYGLVAPGYTMAEIAADAVLGGGGNHFPGADMSTKLKLLGVGVASFGANGRARRR